MELDFYCCPFRLQFNTNISMKAVKVLRGNHFEDLECFPATPLAPGTSMFAACQPDGYFQDKQEQGGGEPCLKPTRLFGPEMNLGNGSCALQGI